MIRLNLMMRNECGEELLVKEIKVPEIEWSDLEVETEEDDVNPAKMMLDIWKQRVIDYYSERYPENQGMWFERPYSSYSFRELQSMADMENYNNRY